MRPQRIVLNRNKRIIVTVLVLLILLSLPFMGSESISLSEVFRPNSPGHRVLFEFRTPRLLVALIAGATLSMIGASYQILFHNALAEPYVLGVSSAVTFGAVMAEIAGASNPAAGATIGFSFAMFISVLLVWMSSTGFSDSPARVLLFGMGLNFVLSSTVFLVLSYAYQQMGGGSLRWLFGQLPWAENKEVVRLILMTTPAIFLLFLLGRHLDALSLGDAVSRTLGVAPMPSRSFLLLVTSYLTTTIVVTTGTIGFVGLVVPHAARLVFRPASTRILFFHCLWMGGIFLCVCDGVSRSLLPPFEFPVGMISTILGGPLFMYLLWKR
jgi:iron complex transport system permease protein